MQPIHIAAFRGHTDVVNYLIDQCGVHPREKANVSNKLCSY